MMLSTFAKNRLFIKSFLSILMLLMLFCTPDALKANASFDTSVTTMFSSPANTCLWKRSRPPPLSGEQGFPPRKGPQQGNRVPSPHPAFPSALSALHAFAQDAFMGGSPPPTACRNPGHVASPRRAASS